MRSSVGRVGFDMTILLGSSDSCDISVELSRVIEQIDVNWEEPTSPKSLMNALDSSHNSYIN